ncbi:hypothetical protein DENSPDRAFT_597728 [Dentipellis sp. KUC8613]|nr:hypothetical protein DENSPDRAFT_597728 [Dentipellis sp. KUC8613]
MDLVSLHAAGSYSPVPIESPRPNSMRAGSPTPSSNILPPSPEPHSPRSAHTHSIFTAQSSHGTHSTFVSARSAPTAAPEAQLRWSAIPSDLQTLAEPSQSRSASVNTRRRGHRGPPTTENPSRPLPERPSRPMSQRQLQRMTGSEWSELPSPPPPYNGNEATEPMPDDLPRKIVDPTVADEPETEAEAGNVDEVL